MFSRSNGLGDPSRMNESRKIIRWFPEGTGKRFKHIEEIALTTVREVAYIECNGEKSGEFLFNSF